MAASRLQRWAIILSAYDYNVEYEPSKSHGNSDGLSRLPIDSGQEIHTDDSEDIVCALEQGQIQLLPVQARNIARATTEDPILSQVYNYTLYGWPTSIEAVPCTLRTFFGKRFQLNISNGCLLWRLRVVVPEKYKSNVLSLLHERHPGMTRMKSPSRLHVWWSSIDADIEETVRQCQPCAENARDLIRVPLHQWEEPLRPWQRIPIDLAGPFKGKMWLVLIDVYSK